MQLHKVPTGTIGIIDGEYGQLECLVVAGYGKEKNMHADFLGLYADVAEVGGELMPLSEKMVVTISTQYGCSSKCRFCDVPRVGPGRNATVRDLNNQITFMIASSGCARTKRLNVHYARMGEPTWNRNVTRHATGLYDLTRSFMKCKVIHPVVSTMLPRGNGQLADFLSDWCLAVKNLTYAGDAGLQFSINSTDEAQRNWLFGGSSLSLSEISALADQLPVPSGRKYTLNFAMTAETKISGRVLAALFDPARWLVKLTPVHAVKAAEEHRLTGDFVYKPAEEACKEAGFDVIVFIPSAEEESGRITCGNALLADKEG